MAELADAIVQSGRETLENAIRMVNGHPEWRAQVVYGDTGGCRGRAGVWCEHVAGRRSRRAPCPGQGGRCASGSDAN